MDDSDRLKISLGLISIFTLLVILTYISMVFRNSEIFKYVYYFSKDTLIQDLTAFLLGISSALSISTVNKTQKVKNYAWALIALLIALYFLSSNLEIHQEWIRQNIYDFENSREKDLNYENIVKSGHEGVKAMFSKMRSSILIVVGIVWGLQK
jgi:hypothetical protein